MMSRGVSRGTGDIFRTHIAFHTARTLISFRVWRTFISFRVWRTLREGYNKILVGDVREELKAHSRRPNVRHGAAAQKRGAFGLEASSPGRSALLGKYTLLRTRARLS